MGLVIKNATAIVWIASGALLLIPRLILWAQGGLGQGAWGPAVEVTSFPWTFILIFVFCLTLIFKFIRGWILLVVAIGISTAVSLLLAAFFSSGL